jgi:branched-subunit amino acid aminotransferase/4-amino-4-deoxychorismate lyase
MTAPAPHVLLNNLLLPSDEAHISATSEGFLYGHGVFETIKIIDGRPVFFTQHHARLTTSARALDLPYAVDAGTLRERLHRVIAANAVTSGSAKVAVFNDGETTGELITAKSGLYPEETYVRGFRLKTTFTGERTGALSSHKTLNYLANIRAKRSALAAGFDEALFVTPAGIIIEGATTNLFIVRDGVVFTPPLASGPLPGIVRGEVLARLGPVRARETLLTTTDLQHADEIFVTNSLLGIMPVSSLDERILDLARAPITQTLLKSHRIQELDSAA